MFDHFKIRPAHRDVDLLVSLALAALFVVFPDVRTIVSQNADIVQVVLIAIGGRFGVRAAGAVAAGLAMRDTGAARVQDGAQ